MSSTSTSARSPRATSKRRSAPSSPARTCASRGIPLEHCTASDDGRVCAVEYNVVRWGRTELPPQAGVAVYVRGDSGRLALARIYDDSDPPLERS